MFFTPGETEASGYRYMMTEACLYGLIAQATKAAVVMIERMSLCHQVHAPPFEYIHAELPSSDRYWGESSPFAVQDTKALQYLTLDNAIADLVHFAREVALPFDASGSSNAPNSVNSVSFNCLRTSC